MRGIEPDTIVDGRYRILRWLGSGGMADVYCAQDEELGRKVALKLLYRNLAEDSQFVERFRREASSAAGLQHPNVVGIFDRGEWDGTYYIAMEYVEGRTLKDIIRERGPAPPDAAVDIVLQILRAARFAHRRGVVHRDIKPHNVLIDDEGRVKVADFGIARAGASDVTETGSIMGTAQYISPEQAEGRPVDARSDLYSIGIVLYELLTGRVPFDAESPVTIALMQVNEAPMPPMELNPSIPPALDAVVMRALEKDPARRFADADEFIDALTVARAAPQELPAFAPAPVVDELVEEERRGLRWWLWLLILLALAAIGVGLYLTLKPEETTVPNVVGQKSANASQILKNRGFEVDIEQVVNADVPRDEVAAQDPRPGTQADEGSTVRLTVSSGPGQATVPDVTGRTQADAQDALRAAGFKTDVQKLFSDDVRNGRVIETSPPQGTLTEAGRTVTLRVSRGPEQAQVPDVVGDSEDNARSAIEGAGLRVGQVTEEESDHDPGTVTAQDPGQGTQVAKGSAVDLTIAKATPVPDVVDRSEDAARHALEDAGFEVRVSGQVVDSEAKDGVVLDQSPAGGEDRPQGTRVTIVVGRFEAAMTPTATPTPTPTPTPTATGTP